jgi:hypothetical protein
MLIPAELLYVKKINKNRGKFAPFGISDFAI